MRTPRWRAKSLTSTVGHVSASAGLYAIGHIDSTLGLELGRTIMYIGQSKNLRRRFAEHSHLAESNPCLASYLRRNRSRVRIWYATDVPRLQINTLERQLIRQLDPVCNRVKYKRSEKP